MSKQNVARFSSFKGRRKIILNIVPEGFTLERKSAKPEISRVSLVNS